MCVHGCVVAPKDMTKITTQLRDRRKKVDYAARRHLKDEYRALRKEVCLNRRRRHTHVFQPKLESPVQSVLQHGVLCLLVAKHHRDMQMGDG